MVDLNYLKEVLTFAVFLLHESNTRGVVERQLALDCLTIKHKSALHQSQKAPVLVYG
jgi:hypothetical protein